MDRTSRGIFFLRVVVGGGFLFAGLDKFFMLAGGTPFTAAGFLKGATGGAWLGSTGVVNPTHPFWASLAGNASLMSVIDTLVVFGECAVGIALILGLATRFAGICGAVMIATGPFNEQFMYGVIAGTIAFVGAGAYALDSVVEKLAITQRIPVVKYALG
jgi:thiosulfate dehydrogenase [quinone] large subunit